LEEQYDRYQKLSMADVVKAVQRATVLRVDCRKSEGVQPNDFRNAAVKWL
jgi:hypothetical protein